MVNLTKVRAVYEIKLSRAYVYALKKNVITNRNGVFTLEILLGVEDRAVIAFFPKNTSLQKL
jgi:hypothetical protein